MTDQNEPKFQLGTVFGLEKDIRAAAEDFAAEAHATFETREKRLFAGPNDLIYILLHIDIWTQLIPWAAISVSTGALSKVGGVLVERYFPSKTTKQLAQLTEEQKC